MVSQIYDRPQCGRHKRMDLQKISQGPESTHCNNILLVYIVLTFCSYLLVKLKYNFNFWLLFLITT